MLLHESGGFELAFAHETLPGLSGMLEEMFSQFVLVFALPFADEAIQHIRSRTDELFPLSVLLLRLIAESFGRHGIIMRIRRRIVIRLNHSI